MNTICRTALVAIAMTVPLLSWSGPLDEGKRLMEEGRTEEALVQLRKAARQGTLAAYPILVEYSLEQYDTDGAEEYIDAWRSRLSRNRKPAPESLDSLAGQLVKLRNMLARVEKIEILDSITVPRDEFFTAYRLSAPAGRILPPASVERIVGHEEHGVPSMAYMPENRSEILWAAADSAGRTGLFGAGILDDGTPEPGHALDSGLAEGGSAGYPFLMPDGVTLYFANNGENSLGGYDIFMTRREDSEGETTYYRPQNMGMPYNSPYDDYMLAIDENSGLGWFATDRNQIPDSVTVYVFTPEAMRVNVEPEDSNLVALAKLSDIGLTRRPGTDYAALLAGKLPSTTSPARDDSDGIFCVDMGNGRIYTTLGDFRSRDARSAMVEYLGTLGSLRRHLADEEALRRRYSRGEVIVGSDILDSEQQTAYLRRTAAAQLNRAIRLETQP